MDIPPFMPFLTALLVSLTVVRLAIRVAPILGVMDEPTGHKTHQDPIPYVGGFGVMGALILFMLLNGWLGFMDPQALLAFAGSATILFLTGLADDRWNLSFRLRLIIETGAALLMIWGTGVYLVDLGELWPGVTATLGILAIPITILGLLSITNALNMIDGVDGLSGSLALVSLTLLGVVAFLSQTHVSSLLLAITLAGGLLGFLFFNLRVFGRRRADVFLGDNGSILLGFMLGWLFIDLSQGEQAAMTPVTALYFFSLPLFDSLTAITRRLWLGKSPFHPDRSHLHHLFLAAGASVETTVHLLVVLHLTIGLIGLAGLLTGVPEWLMFALFLSLYGLYATVVWRPWRFVPATRRLLVHAGFTLKHGTGVFIGPLNSKDLQAVLAQVAEVLIPNATVRICQQERLGPEPNRLFVIVDFGSWYEARPALSRLRKRLSLLDRVYDVRQYIERDPEHDRRLQRHQAPIHRRRIDRRTLHPVRELYRFQQPEAPIGPRLLEQLQLSLDEALG
jgi:UDP-GlcNAc:undecaprenyl-phosphate/decaprenyl-phosphate GlcNAc-1-phosphate transferase